MSAHVTNFDAYCDVFTLRMSIICDHGRKLLIHLCGVCMLLVATCSSLCESTSRWREPL